MTGMTAQAVHKTKESVKASGLVRARQSAAVGRLVGRDRMQVLDGSSVGAVHDRYEQEADRVADQVMRNSVGESVGKPTPGARSRPVITRLAPGTLQRQSMEEEELQAKGAAGDAVRTGARAERAIASLGRGGEPLAASERAFFEPRFGRSFEHVRIHTGPRVAAAAKSIDALAFTVGNHIAFPAGRSSPATSNNRRLLAHELTHTVQQRGDGAGLMIQRAKASLWSRAWGGIKRGVSSAARWTGRKAKAAAYWTGRKIARGADWVADKASYAAASAGFVAGFFQSFGNSVINQVAGVAKIVKAIWKNLYKLPSAVAKLFKSIAKISWASIKQGVGRWADKWTPKFYSRNPWVAGHARGYLTGYVFAELAALFVGVGAAAKAAHSVLSKTKLGKAVLESSLFITVSSRVANAGSGLAKVAKAAGSAVAEGSKAVGSAVAKGAKAVGTGLQAARLWAATQLKLSAYILKNMSLAGLKRLQRLSKAAQARLRGLSERAKRWVCGCASPCIVSLERLKILGLSRGMLEKIGRIFRNFGLKMNAEDLAVLLTEMSRLTGHSIEAFRLLFGDNFEKLVGLLARLSTVEKRILAEAVERLKRGKSLTPAQQELFRRMLGEGTTHTTAGRLPRVVDGRGSTPSITPRPVGPSPQPPSRPRFPPPDSARTPPPTVTPALKSAPPPAAASTPSPKPAPTPNPTPSPAAAPASTSTSSPGLGKPSDKGVPGKKSLADLMTEELGEKIIK